MASVVAVLTFPSDTAADQLTDEDQLQPAGDENDSPLIVPPPGSILRRAARTKIRKNSLLGDGNGHRFGPNKRSPRASPYSGLAPGSDDGHGDQSRRTVSVGSVGSLGSLEETSFEREPAPEPQRSPRSPDRPTFMAPIPPQYMAPASTDIDGASAETRASPERNALSTARSGADMPNLRASPSPPNRAASLPQQLGSNSPSPPPVGHATSIDQIRQEAAERLTGSMDNLAVEARPVRSPSPSHGQEQRQLSPSPLPTGARMPQLAQAQSQVQYDAKPPPPRNVSEDSTPLAQTLHERQVMAQQGGLRPAHTEGASMSGNAGPSSCSSMSDDPRRPPQYPTPAPQQVPVPPPVAQSQQVLSPPQREKKSTWARLGLSRSGKDDTNDIDDAASIMSASSNSSGFSTVSTAKKGKKGKKDKHEPVDPRRATHPPAQDKEKDKHEASGGFFGGLFGSKKKPDSAEVGKRDTQPAYLQLPTPPPTASGMLTADGKYVNFYRLPIHIERAVYRLSHIKLANPRRPLYEQVLISNLMFWYLG